MRRSVAIAVVVATLCLGYVSAGNIVSYGFVEKDGEVMATGGNWNSNNFNITKAGVGVYCVGGDTGTYGTVLVTAQTPNVVGRANTGTGNTCNEFGGTLISLTVSTTGQAVDSPFSFMFLPSA